MNSSSGNGLEPGEHTSLLGHEQHEHHGHHHHPKNRIWVRWPMQVVRLAWLTLVRDYVNLLLIFVPLGIIAGALHWDSSAVFTLNFLAIIPLASLLSFATEELAGTMGQALGGLMNATFGNAVELIVRATFPF